ncbi:hypothetical protein J7I98_30805 [Streptomyces sp. ISL-98]|uniref:hypothetical protein n=1 Tax=Streptomyces sp. ISL-98 TaxID=2819192 RepID=UPI001BE7773B|nr:hypothetical protein [Streptomyces sp. ISL-98]MBT2510167.1 hypothetical protein [Streptomyces sp. ISL-98]
MEIQEGICRSLDRDSSSLAAQRTIIGCLLAMVVDAMSGMVTQVRLPRRDEMNAYYRALPLGDLGNLRPNRHAGDTNA